MSFADRDYYQEKYTQTTKNPNWNWLIIIGAVIILGAISYFIFR